jgi:hypothetical protein
MNETEAIQKVQSHFGYLFDRFAYRVIACRLFANNENWIVVLESPSCGRFLVMQDRGEIIVALGPHGSPDSATNTRWFDLSVVVEYLSEGVHMVEDRPGDPERQMVHLAEVLYPYMEQVGPLFVGENFSAAAEEMDRIGRRREEAIREREAGNDGDRDGGTSNDGKQDDDGYVHLN